MSADVLWDRGGVAGLRLGGAPFFRVRRAPASDVEPLNGHDAPGGIHQQGGFTDLFRHRWSVGDGSPLAPFPR